MSASLTHHRLLVAEFCLRENRDEAARVGLFARAMNIQGKMTQCNCGDGNALATGHFLISS